MMVDAEDLTAWEALEATCWTLETMRAQLLAERETEETRRIDLVRIRGFALVVARQSVEAKDRLEKAIDGMDRARRKAERELARCNRISELAERACTFAARAMAGDADADTVREVACALEEMFG